MVLKVTAFGPCGYVKSRWNIFDGFIVVISIVDLILERVVNVGSGAGLSVLRTLRLVSDLQWSMPLGAPLELSCLVSHRERLTPRHVTSITMYLGKRCPINVSKGMFKSIERHLLELSETRSEKRC